MEAKTSNQKKTAWESFWENYPEENQSIDKTLEKINYKFNNKYFLYEALCHRSAHFSFTTLHPALKITYNEKLEFLGDAVLELTVSDFIYKKYPLVSEGELSKIRAHLVKKTTLAHLARKIELTESICLSHSEKKNGGSNLDSITSNALEALIGAIFLDSNYESVRQVVVQLYDQFTTTLSSTIIIDHKSKLQEKIQKELKQTPSYKTIDSSGPDHLRSYHIGVYVNSQKVASGWGANKKKASQEAALAALKKLNSKIIYPHQANQGKIK